MPLGERPWGSSHHASRQLRAWLIRARQQQQQPAAAAAGPAAALVRAAATDAVPAAPRAAAAAAAASGVAPAAGAVGSGVVAACQCAEEEPPGASRRARVPMTRLLPPHTTEVLWRWACSHAAYPYPTESEKVQLMAAADMTSEQLRNWVSNVRRRELRPLEPLLEAAATGWSAASFAAAAAVAGPLVQEASRVLPGPAWMIMPGDSATAAAAAAAPAGPPVGHGRQVCVEVAAAVEVRLGACVEVSLSASGAGALENGYPFQLCRDRLIEALGAQGLLRAGSCADGHDFGVCRAEAAAAARAGTQSATRCLFDLICFASLGAHAREKYV